VLKVQTCGIDARYLERVGAGVVENRRGSPKYQFSLRRAMASTFTGPSTIGNGGWLISFGPTTIDPKQR
jgi:hypothetical protein